MSRSRLVSIAKTRLTGCLFASTFYQPVHDHRAQEAQEGGDQQTDEHEARPGRAQQPVCAARARGNIAKAYRAKTAIRSSGTLRAFSSFTAGCAASSGLEATPPSSPGPASGSASRLQLVLDAEPRREPRQQRPQIERHGPVRGRDVPVPA